MKTLNDADVAPKPNLNSDPGDDLLLRLIDVPAKSNESTGGVIVGRLIAQENGVIPLVTFRGHATEAAVRARSVVDLHVEHIGKEVLLAFDSGDLAKPIIIGVLRGEYGWPSGQAPQNVEVDADGQRVAISARDQLVLRCGDASVTLSRDGKVVIRGKHVVTHASGVNRIRGGSVELN